MTNAIAPTANVNADKAWKELLAWRLLGHHMINRLRTDRGLPGTDTPLMDPIGAIDMAERMLAEIGEYQGGHRPDVLEAMVYEFTCAQPSVTA